MTAIGVHARAWHRRAGDAVAALATVDGIVFELAWFHTSRWAEELARAGVLPEDCPMTDSEVPAFLDLPFELADAASEAARSGRSDLLPVLTEQSDGAALGVDGESLGANVMTSVLTALTAESRGRLRVLVADVTGDETTVVGVVSWTLLADGWHALRPRDVEGRHRIQIAAVTPIDLATELAPVLAEVTA